MDAYNIAAYAEDGLNAVFFHSLSMIVPLFFFAVMATIAASDPDISKIFMLPFLLVALPIILLIILPLYLIVSFFDKKGYRKEKAEYEKKREDSLRQLKEAMLEGGRIDAYPGKADACITYTPSGKVSMVGLACDAEKYFRRKLPLDVQPGDDVEDLLTSADAMLLMTGSHKDIAAEKVIERTKEKCASLKDVRSLYFSKSDYIFGFDDSGKVISMIFDLPIEMLFTDIDAVSDGRQGFEGKSGEDMVAFLTDRVIRADDLLKKVRGNAEG